jgi:MFS family permease
LSDIAAPRSKQRGQAFAPLRDRLFRAIWSASVLSNFGQLILGVAAAWQMTRLANTPSMVALVQTALLLPLMLVAVPAGAAADMFDRRLIALVGLGFSFLAALVLTGLSWAGFAGPWTLLSFCFLIGGGVAFYQPAWQASIREQVPPEQLAAAVSLSSVSHSFARSFGPAVGGLIVVAAGATVAFLVNALLYLPLIAAFLFWKRTHVPPRLPPERLTRAIISGVRYAVYAAQVRSVMVRCVVFGVAGSSVLALTPLVARDLLGGDAVTYGILLAATGVGAVGGALLVGGARELMSSETVIRWSALATGLSILTIGFSDTLALTATAMAVTGAANMLIISLMNVAVQMSVPRWVSARALAWFQSSLMGGFAFGAWLWGHVAGVAGLETAMACSAASMTVVPLIGLLMPIPEVVLEKLDPADVGRDPEVALAITARSGPDRGGDRLSCRSRRGPCLL